MLFFFFFFGGGVGGKKLGKKSEGHGKRIKYT